MGNESNGGGIVAANLNSFFRSYRGLRHGDMLSPLLFNLVADGMAGILKAIVRKELSQVYLGPELVEGGLIDFYYDDCSVLFMGNSTQNIANYMFLLFCFIGTF